MIHSIAGLTPQPKAQTADDRTQQLRAEFPVALVTMPFASIGPSLQLGLLKSLAQSHGFPTTTFHLNVDLVRYLGIQAYESLAEHRGPLVGEWLFSVSAFGESAPDQQGRFLGAFGSQLELSLADLYHADDWLLNVRNVVIPQYLNDVFTSIPWHQFRVVGFTSTFQQNTASFALARRIKDAHPRVLIVFGGANFDGDMGGAWMEAFPWIDYAVVGEGDVTFMELLASLAASADTAKLPGVMCRTGSNLNRLVPREPTADLDSLPIPDFDEYFERLDTVSETVMPRKRSIAIPFEGSRGCWWGQKQHCTFCGLNRDAMKYRSKSSKRLLRELNEYALRYNTETFEAVDNILDLRYLKEFFPTLIEYGVHWRFFYEIKANLTREQIDLLFRAGVHSLQPGIESLSTAILHLMRKGSRAIQNVNTLRWLCYYGINVSWNILFGFPGETEEDYRAQLALMVNLTHLQPPGKAARIWMERFSPLFTADTAFPKLTLRPESSYAFVYPAGVDLKRAAYFFDYELKTTLPDAAFEPTVAHVRQWRTMWQAERRPTFTFLSNSSGLLLEDERTIGARRKTTLTGVDAKLYAACSDRPQTVEALRKDVAPSYSDRIEPTLRRFSDEGWMMCDGGLFLSLAIPYRLPDCGRHS